MPLDEIEITPEMIEAGVGKLLGFYAEDAYDTPQITVAEVYKAMATLAPRPRV